MSVYVDPLHAWKGRKWCHMVSNNIEELHFFAVSIGLKFRWFQNKSIPHYDLVESKRKLAVKQGAVEITSRELVAMMRPQKQLQSLPSFKLSTAKKRKQ